MDTSGYTQSVSTRVTITPPTHTHTQSVYSNHAAHYSRHVHELEHHFRPIPCAEQRRLHRHDTGRLPHCTRVHHRLVVLVDRRRVVQDKDLGLELEHTLGPQAGRGYHGAFTNRRALQLLPLGQLQTETAGRTTGEEERRKEEESKV